MSYDIQKHIQKGEIRVIGVCVCVCLYTNKCAHANFFTMVLVFTLRALFAKTVYS